MCCNFHLMLEMTFNVMFKHSLFEINKIGYRIYGMEWYEIWKPLEPQLVVLAKFWLDTWAAS